MGKKIDTTSLIGYVAILVIIISLANIGVRLTGRVTDTGVVNVTIESRADINFTTDLINFGSGQVDEGQASCDLTTVGAGTNTTGNWTGTGDNFVIENIGNVNVTLQLASGKDASEFLGGTTPGYFYNVSNIETGSCTEGGDITLGAWTAVDKVGAGDEICAPLGFADGADTISIDIKLTIPSDATVGQQTDTFTATATAA